MNQTFEVVDIFAGPGGLAEGFASVRVRELAPFSIALSVEKEGSAHRTLTLRHFLRQFGNRFPEEYYRHLDDPNLIEHLRGRYTGQWETAEKNSLQRELGKPGVQEELNPVLDRIRERSQGNSVLVGGPPCQAYSLVGRARNRGVVGYVAREDHRHYLYQEYIRILDRLQPAAFVMENVKGILSSTVDNQLIFELVLDDLRTAGGEPDNYVLVPLAAGGAAKPEGRDFLVRAEDHGVPQARHRVIVVGLRKDKAEKARSFLAGWTGLPATPFPSVVRDVLSGIPRLRSGLSGGPDDEPTWRGIREMALA